VPDAVRSFAPLLVLLAACSGSSSADGGSPAESACASSASTRCDKIDSCGGGIGILRAYGDRTACLARQVTSCLGSQSAPYTGTTPSIALACAAATSAEACDDYYATVTPTVCIVRGMLADGRGCAFNGQCNSTYCNIPRGSACGTCGSPPAAGDDCSSIPCGRGTVCLEPAFKCQTPIALGSACALDETCGPGRSCVGATSTTKGTCMDEQAMLGAACDSRLRNMSRCNADLGLYCNGSPGMCVMVSYATDAGASCGRTDGGYASCGAGGACIGDAGSSVCQSPAADDGACDLVNGPPCFFPARCVTNAGSNAGKCRIVTGGECL
jgi:hypothetical protein